MAYALGLVFDPRYRGFPASSLIGGTAALLVLTLPGRRGMNGVAERCAAAVLAIAAIAVVAVEGWPINTEAVAYAVTILILAGTLAGVPVGRGRRGAG
jgi:glucan 1,3-beta-glucosidase